ncbi:ABC transporter ATP-binding protein [Glutamicibacter sp. NPDC087344]|uniref:ABC transporter ATP-binding protein n=1 Tax=Glutamicibacter sp. NPDC087344 TaxID=3363994 RepID=UPI00382875BB
MNAIEVHGLHKSFKDLHVLHGVDLSVAAGSIYALLGSNGAGKTTLVQILSTLLRADAGQVLVNGSNPATHPQQVRESLTLTGQFATIDGMLTGRENLLLIARLRRASEPEHVAEELLKRFDLTEAASRRASTYSGGMLRRLDLAMGLVGKTPIVILDEPTTGLDPQSRILTWNIIRDLAAAGTTVMLTTQYLDEAEQLADRIAILHEGRIIQEGTLAELRKLLPPAKIEHILKEPTLEDIFLSLVGSPSITEEASS